MFNLHGFDRLTEWKKFRDNLELSETPLKDVAEFWGNAPFVSAYLDPKAPANWPDPWHLVLDLRLDDLAISLGMLYTLKLTTRFMGSKFEIHKSMSPDKGDPRFFLTIDDKFVLNLEYKEVVDISTLDKTKASLIWSV